MEGVVAHSGAGAGERRHTIPEPAAHAPVAVTADRLAAINGGGQHGMVGAAGGYGPIPRAPLSVMPTAAAAAGGVQQEPIGSSRRRVDNASKHKPSIAAYLEQAAVELGHGNSELRRMAPAEGSLSASVPAASLSLTEAMAVAGAGPGDQPQHPKEKHEGGTGHEFAEDRARVELSAGTVTSKEGVLDGSAPQEEEGGSDPATVIPPAVLSADKDESECGHFAAAIATTANVERSPVGQSSSGDTASAAPTEKATTGAEIPAGDVDRASSVPVEPRAAPKLLPAVADCAAGCKKEGGEGKEADEVDDSGDDRAPGQVELLQATEDSVVEKDEAQSGGVEETKGCAQAVSRRR